jgi:methionyl-tRNA formyltransferase
LRDRPTRVIAVTQDDPFFTGSFFATFLPECARAGVDLLEIVVLPNFNERKTALARRLLRFYGPIGFVRLLLRYGGAAWSDRRGRPRSVAAIAGRHGVPVRRLRTINDPEYLRTVSSRRVDVLLSVSAPQIFAADALSAAPLALNVHSGKLPEYRGMMPTFWALANGDEQVTVTVHEMVEQLDAGPIVRELEVAVGPGDTVFAVAAHAKDVAGPHVARLLAHVDEENRGSWRLPEPPSEPAYRFPTPRDVRRLRSRGRRLL